MSDDDTDCTNPMAIEWADKWSNHSTTAFDGDLNLFISYVCRYAEYEFATQQICSSIEGYASLILGTFGLLGALASVSTLWQRRYKLLQDFTLFRCVGYLEMVHMSFIVTITVLAFFRCESSYVCTFLWAHMATSINNISADAVDLIVFFLSFERTVACLFPHIFKRLHTPGFVRTVIFVSLIVPSFFAVCQSFEVRIEYNAGQDRFVDLTSEFAQTDFYAAIVQINSIRLYVSAILITLATVASIIGFRTVTVRQKRLKRGSTATNTDTNRKYSTSYSESHFLIQKQNPRKSETSSISAGSKKRQSDLCSLQLCLATPVVVNLLLYTTGLSTTYNFITGEDTFKSNYTYHQAIDEIDRAESFLILRTATNVSNVLAHALHFYLYLLFSNNVRKGFVELIKEFRKKIMITKTNVLVKLCCYN